jgi:hypothetical protein
LTHTIKVPKLGRGMECWVTKKRKKDKILLGEGGKEKEKAGK